MIESVICFGNFLLVVFLAFQTKTTVGKNRITRQINYHPSTVFNRKDECDNNIIGAHLYEKLFTNTPIKSKQIRRKTLYSLRSEF